MTIHSEHPFATPDPDKNPVRRLRGRLPAPVTIVALGAGRSRVGLTVSSILVVEPESIVFVVNEMADLADDLEVGVPVAVSVLQAGDDQLAEVFAGLAPSPGGMFTTGDWVDSKWGPRLADHSWVGARVVEVRAIAWSHVVTVRIEHVDLTDGEGVAHVRGRYRA